MTHNHTYLQNLLNLLGFEHKNSAIYSKTYAQHQHYTITVNFETEKIDYPKPIILGDKTTSNFEASENFVVLECVNRLLEQGYKPENISLEKKWKLGHNTKGKVDVFVQYPEHYLPNTEKSGVPPNSKAFLLIECKTWGKEFDTEFKNTCENGGQLLSYFQQEQSTEFLVLYASVLKEDKLIYTNRIIEVKDEFKGKNKAEVFKYWKDELGQIFKYNGIFSDEFEKIEPYNIDLKPLKKRNLEILGEGDSGYLHNQFLEILRHNVVSDKPNAFNKMFNLILAKIYDEGKDDSEILDFQILGNQDTDIDLQKRINDLYKNAMKFYLDKDVTDFSDKKLNNYMKSTLSREEKQELIKDITELRLYKNQEFAFQEVFNQESFEENAKIVKEVVKLLQPYKLRYSHKQQFLSNLFELLLSNTLKQESGQFFTPVPVASFLANCIPFKEMIEKNIAEKQINFLPYLIDYACASGHFMVEAMAIIQKIINEIDTKGLRTEIKKAIENYQNAANQFDWAGKYVYGIEKDYRLAKIAKVSGFLNGDGLANIFHADGLDSFSESKHYKGLLKRNDKSLENPVFDVLLANPPYSVSAFIKTLPKVKECFELYHQDNNKNNSQFTDKSKEIEILFIERTKQLTKENGFVGIILPSSLLNGGVYESARAMILEYFRIVAIVEFGSGTFMATGTNTITLFLQRRNNNEITQLKNQIDKIFAEKNLLGFEKQASLEAYITHTHNVSAAYYLTFVNQNTNEVFAATELYQNYVKWYEKLTETVNLKDKITKLETNLLKLKVSLSKSTEQEAEKTNIKITETEAELAKAKADLTRKFYEKLTEQEKEKMTYFFLAYEQKTILVKTNPKGNNDAEKEFLGYEFSNRRGHEGIRMFTDAENQPTTKLYHETNRQDFTKVSSYIYQAFLDNNLSKFENLANLAAENGLSENLQIQNLYEMMNFESISFDKAIATSFKKKVETEVKYKSECKSVESVLTKIQGSTTKIDKSEYKTQGKTPIISQEKIFISGYTDLEIEAITDLPLIVFGDHTKIFKFINFPFVRGADGVCLLKPNSNYFIPKAFFYIIESLDFEGQQDYTRHYKFLSKTLIPIPDFSVQQKIISEIEEIEQQETSQKERKEVLKSEIESVLIKIESIEKVALKNIALLQKGKTITKSQTTIGKIPVIAGGKEPAYYHNVANENKNVITVSASGANAGFISYHTQEIWASDCITIRSYNETEISTYLIFKFLAMQQKNIYELQRGQAQPHVYVNDLEKMKIPLPPLEIQTQILAKILILETELTKIAKFLDTVKAMKETVLQKYL